VALPPRLIVTKEADVHAQAVSFTPGKWNKSEHWKDDADIPPLSVLESKVANSSVPSLENCTDTSTGTGGGTSNDSTV
jgi:hypothetical protein